MLTEQDRAVRRGRITGTRIGAIVGLSKYKTPIEVYREITEGLDGADPESSDILRGRYLEPGILAWYRHVADCEVTPAKATVHPKYDYCAATPDAQVIGHKKIVEVKAPRYPSDWGPDGSDQVPDYHVPQVAWEMACTDSEEVDVVALVSGDLRIYTIKRDLELELELLKAAREFWEDHILTGTPPPVDGTAAYSNYLTSRYPRSSKRLLEADVEQEDLLRLYFDAKARLNRAEEQERALRNRLQEVIGEAGGLVGEAGKITWSTVNGRKTVDYKALVQELGVKQEIIDRHTKRGGSYRRFMGVKS